MSEFFDTRPSFVGMVPLSGAIEPESQNSMKGYTANAQSMTDVAAIIERARSEGLDLGTALRIARTTLVYVSGARPDQGQVEALKTLDRHLSDIRAEGYGTT